MAKNKINAALLGPTNTGKTLSYTSMQLKVSQYGSFYNQVLNIKSNILV